MTLRHKEKLCFPKISVKGFNDKNKKTSRKSQISFKKTWKIQAPYPLKK